MPYSHIFISCAARPEGDVSRKSGEILAVLSNALVARLASKK